MAKKTGTNPNWPSKTGNPSGPKRGNNPAPKPTPKPAPTPKKKQFLIVELCNHNKKQGVTENPQEQGNSLKNEKNEKNKINNANRNFSVDSFSFLDFLYDNQNKCRCI